MNLRRFPGENYLHLYTENPQHFLKIPARNLWRILVEYLPKFPLKFHVDSRFTYNPNFFGGSPPPSIHHPRWFPADFARWGSGIKHERKCYAIGVLRNTTLTFCLFLQTEGSSLDQLQRSSTMIDTSEEEGLIQVNEFWLHRWLLLCNSNGKGQGFKWEI